MFQFVFEEPDAPGAAALRLLLSASRFAASVGFALAVPATPELALLVVGDLMGEFARGVHNAGGELCVCFDELQVRKQHAWGASDTA